MPLDLRRTSKASGEGHSCHMAAPSLSPAISSSLSLTLRQVCESPRLDIQSGNKVLIFSVYKWAPPHLVWWEEGGLEAPLSPSINIAHPHKAHNPKDCPSQPPVLSLYGLRLSGGGEGVKTVGGSILPCHRKLWEKTLNPTVTGCLSNVGG